MPEENEADMRTTEFVALGRSGGKETVIELLKDAGERLQRNNADMYSRLLEAEKAATEARTRVTVLDLKLKQAYVDIDDSDRALNDALATIETLQARVRREVTLHNKQAEGWADEVNQLQAQITHLEGIVEFMENEITPNPVTP